MNFKDRLRGCLTAGAIGDAIGYKYEGTTITHEPDFEFEWYISDDTQLTIATCEAIYNTPNIKPEKVAERFMHWYSNRKLTGLGASTLKALRELQVGGHWALVGRSGEYAAGNGAAMRIAPLAFKKYVDRLTIRDVCNITHKNDEAYSGALAIFYAINSAITETWIGNDDLIPIVIDKIPDSLVRDKLIELNNIKDLSLDSIGKIYTPTGYVADSVPISIFAAQKINLYDFKAIITSLIRMGEDTDTVCSMFGQIVGALKGISIIPDVFMDKFNKLQIAPEIDEIVYQWTE